MNEQQSRARTARTKAVGTAKRLAVREYLPLASWILSWFMIGIAIGHADAVRLLAANAFVQAVRHVCTLEAMPLFGLRERTAETFRQARRAATRLELAGLAASVVGVLLLVGLLEYRGLGQVAVMVAIAAAAIPARTPAALLVAHRQRFPIWRIGSGLTFAAGSAAVLLFGGDWMAAAAVLALREWGALIATLLFAPEAEEQATAEHAPHLRGGGPPDRSKRAAKAELSPDQFHLQPAPRSVRQPCSKDGSGDGAARQPAREAGSAQEVRLRPVHSGNGHGRRDLPVRQPRTFDRARRGGVRPSGGVWRYGADVVALRKRRGRRRGSGRGVEVSAAAVPARAASPPLP